MSRWRLILGEEISSLQNVCLGEMEGGVDSALNFIYGGGGVDDNGRARGGKKAGKGNSSPNLARWLVDVRTFFPPEVVSIIQSDAIERKGLKKILFEPETLKNLKPDVSLVGTLMSLRGLIPEKAKDTARYLVQQVVDDIMKQLEQELRHAVMGALNKKKHSPIPHFASIDWKRTINKNLKNYDSDSKRLIPERFYFFENHQREKKWKVILDIDQSGSMAESIIYASVMGSIFASMPVLETHVVVFDTNVVDMTDVCRHHPVDMLFGIQLGGGTNINKSVTYCERFIENPEKTIFILISDLEEGSGRKSLVRRLSQMHNDGVKVLCLLALSDKGTASYNESVAQEISNQGISCFACTPDQLANLVAKTLGA